MAYALQAYAAYSSGKKARRRRRRQAREVMRAAQARADTERRGRQRMVGEQIALAGASGASGPSTFMAILEAVTESALEEEEILKGAVVESRELRKLGKDEYRAGQLGAAAVAAEGVEKSVLFIAGL